MPTPVRSTTNATSIGALVLGIGGLILALLPGLSFLALAAGGLAVVLGFTTRHLSRRYRGGHGADVALAGAILGIGALVVGIVIVMN